MTAIVFFALHWAQWVQNLGKIILFQFRIPFGKDYGNTGYQTGNPKSVIILPKNHTYPKEIIEFWELV